MIFELWQIVMQVDYSIEEPRIFYSAATRVMAMFFTCFGRNDREVSCEMGRYQIILF